MSIKHKLRTLLLCLPLILGSFAGVPMRPEEIEELMHSINQQKIVVTVDESENKEGRFPKLPNGEP